jgi:hypothetical protein
VSVTAADVVGLGGHVLALATGATAVAFLATRRRAWLIAVAVGAAGLGLAVRAGGIPLAGYPRGVAGDLSITTLALLAAALSAMLTGRTVLERPAWRGLCELAAVAGIVGYPLTLGLTQLDPYELGYRPRALVVVLAGLVVAWWWRRRGAALVLAAGVAAFNLRLLESTNLWDYLLDMPLAVCSVGVVAARAVTWRRAPTALQVPAPVPRRAPERPY